MRIRTVKPQYWTHRMHRKISVESALIALALLNYADDDGRFEADAQLFIGQCLPLRPTVDVEAAWRELESCGFIQLYKAEHEGETLRFGSICEFAKHQRINRKTDSVLPPPPCNEHSLSVHEHIRECSSPERKGKEGKGEGEECAPPDGADAKRAHSRSDLKSLLKRLRLPHNDRQCEEWNTWCVDLGCKSSAEALAVIKWVVEYARQLKAQGYDYDRLAYVDDFDGLATNARQWLQGQRGAA